MNCNHQEKVERQMDVDIYLIRCVKCRSARIGRIYPSNSASYQRSYRQKRREEKRERLRQKIAGFHNEDVEHEG